MAGIQLVMAQEPPYHPGERLVQERMGVADEAQRLSRMFAPALDARITAFLAAQRLAVAASVSAEGDVWASLLTGPRGFLQVVDDRLVAMRDHPRADDVLAANVAAQPQLGLLVIHLATRRRLRLNGRAMAEGPHLFLQVQRVYGNCPKYITPREPAFEEGPAVVRRTRELGLEHQRRLRAADTLFIASRHPQAGADASHRGGPPGFVEVHDARTLSFADLPGNNMFNTLGNLAVEPRAGLLVPDFAHGATLQLSGDTEVSFEGRPRVTFHVREVIHTTGRGLRA